MPVAVRRVEAPVRMIHSSHWRETYWSADSCRDSCREPDIAQSRSCYRMDDENRCADLTNDGAIHDHRDYVAWDSYYIRSWRMGAVVGRAGDEAVILRCQTVQGRTVDLDFEKENAIQVQSPLDRVPRRDLDGQVSNFPHQAHHEAPSIPSPESAIPSSSIPGHLRD